MQDTHFIRLCASVQNNADEAETEEFASFEREHFGRLIECQRGIVGGQDRNTMLQGAKIFLLNFRLAFQYNISDGEWLQPGRSQPHNEFVSHSVTALELHNGCQIHALPVDQMIHYQPSGAHTEVSWARAQANSLPLHI